MILLFLQITTATSIVYETCLNPLEILSATQTSTYYYNGIELSAAYAIDGRLDLNYTSSHTAPSRPANLTAVFERTPCIISLLVYNGKGNNHAY